MKIVIIDDHPIVRHGVERALNMEEDIEVTGTAASCPEGLEVLMTEKPDIALVDLKMPGGGGMELIRKAREFLPETRFIILTSYASHREVSEAVSENVEGYLLKEALPEELISAIRLVAGGRRYYDPEIMDSVMIREERDPLRELTRREIEILQSLAQGFNNRTIAEKLYISENTVKKHVCNLLDKLQLEDRTQAALFAFSRGLGKKEGELR